MSHALKIELEEATATVPAVDSSRTCTTAPRGISPSRQSGRARASQIIRDAVRLVGGRPALAASLYVSSTMIDRWCDPADPLAMTLGDILAAREDFARTIISRALSTISMLSAHSWAMGLPLDTHFRRLAVSHGKLGEVLSELLPSVAPSAEQRARLLDRVHELRERLTAFEAELLHQP